MSRFDAEAIALHNAYGGKIAITPTVPLASRDDLSRAYSPGVAAVSRAIAADPSAVYRMTIKKNTIAIVSDGSAILGLGNLGPEAAIPVMEGKAALFKQFAGVDAFPLCLATQDTEEIIRIVTALAPVFGGINLEDIAAPRCFMIEDALRKALSIPVMHDDQHGTAIVVLAGLINAVALRGSLMRDIKIVVNGAGAAGLAITELLLRYGCTQIIVVDSYGTIYPGRDALNMEKAKIANLTNTVCNIDPASSACVRGTLADAIVGADVFIGVSIAGALTPAMIATMAPRPVIFALANPDPEIMPADAQQAGAFIVATGRSDFPNQINNVLAFPGLFRGALDHRIRQFDDAVFIRAAEALAQCITPTPERILPDPFDPAVVPAIAMAVSAL